MKHGVCIQGLHAQAQPPVYYVAQIDVLNEEAYAKDYVPKAQALIKSSGGKFVAIGGAAGGGKVTLFEGDPPRKRVVIPAWESVEKIQAWRDSAEFKEVRRPVRASPNSMRSLSMASDRTLLRSCARPP